MSDADPTVTRTRSADDAARLPRRADVSLDIGADEFERAFGEPLVGVIDVDRWRRGPDLGEEYERIRCEIESAVAQENEDTRTIREHIHPMLAEQPDAPKGAGRHQVSPEQVEYIQRHLLFPGGVVCCDGTSDAHESLALTVHSIGVAAVSYAGNESTWSQRLFRRDLRQRHGDAYDQAIDLMRERARRGSLNRPAQSDELSQLVRRALMSYAERAVLVNRADAVWRMGHGSPAPLECLTGGGSPDLMIRSVRVIRELIENRPKFVFVASNPVDRLPRMIGQALRPFEFAIIGRLDERLAPTVEPISFSARVTVDDAWDGESMHPEKWVLRFVEEVAPKVVYGVYRATMLGPPQVFYAHVDHADVAARVAIADSMFFEQRGFPLLIDLADRTCAAVFGGRSMREIAEGAYVAADMPFAFGTEHDTRHHL